MRISTSQDKPRTVPEPTQATSVSGSPLYYDSGVLYDDTSAYYDRWYPGDGTLTQGEKPQASASYTPTPSRVTSNKPIVKVI